jgi:hypothetical protein
MVKTNKTQKYITRIGQYTGTSNAVENVMKKEIKVARVVDSLYTWQWRSAAAKSTYGRKEVPKLPFRQPADEWTELIVTVARKRGRCIPFTTFQLVRHQVILEGRVELWL